MKTKLFQKQDLARAALHDGLILAWDTGLGKTWGLFLWPLLKLGFERSAGEMPTCPPAHLPTCSPAPGPGESEKGRKGAGEMKPKGSVLILAPGDLHQQIQQEGKTHFHIDVTPIETQERFTELTTDAGRPRLTPDGRPQLPPGFYITSYTQLSINGVLRPPDTLDRDPRELLAWLALPPLPGNPQSAIRNPQSEDHPACQFFTKDRAEVWQEHYTRLHFSPIQTIAELDKRYEAEMRSAEQIRSAELRAEIITGLNESYQVLKQLCCHVATPRLTDLNGAQQDFVLREFLKRYIETATFNDGVIKSYPIGIADCGPGIADCGLPIADCGPSDADESAIPKEDTRPRWNIKCVYSPSLADLCYQAFDCVVIDEGVKMKGTDTYVGLAVRSLIPKFRLVLTATPVKNRLKDIFWLLWWAAGGSKEAIARFPYSDDPAEVERFAGEFMVSERNVSKEEAARAADKPVGGRYKKLTAEVCNIHRLWKLLGPNVLRRRKQDAGEDIVPKVRKVVRCEMGRQQKLAYQYHLNATYLDKNGMEAIVVRLQSLRMAAADPASHLLPEKDGGAWEECACATNPKPQTPNSKPQPGYAGALSPRKRTGAAGRPGETPNPKIRNPQSAIRNPTCPSCHGLGRIALPHRSATSYTPKMATTLQLIQEILARGEQCVVFSAFNDPLDALAKRLQEASVRHCLLDGRTSQKRRGALADVFKRGRFRFTNDDVRFPNPDGNQEGSSIVNRKSSLPVMLAGVECMAEGHSFHLANNVILIAYSWAYDKFIQAINRVHRMLSPKAVNVYVVIVNGTIDRKLEALIQEKGDAAELVLDGQLMGERTEEVNLAELLKIARREFNAEDNTIDEARLELDWPKLCNELRVAQREWDRGALPIADCGLPIEKTNEKKKRMKKPRFIIDQLGSIDGITDSENPQSAIGNRQSNIIPLDGPADNIVAVPEFENQPQVGSPDFWRLRIKQRAARLSKVASVDVWKQL